MRTGRIFVFIWVMLYGRIFLDLVLLFVRVCRFELVCISLIRSIILSLIHLHDFQLLEITFSLYQQNNSASKLKWKCRQVGDCCKKVFEAAKFDYANNTKESITFWGFGSCDFWWIANSVFNKGNSAISAKSAIYQMHLALIVFLGWLWSVCLNLHTY